jgi:hypothetical protein
MEKIEEYIRTSRETAAISDTKGHIFIQRQYFKPTDCGICSDNLNDSQNTGLECTYCKLICHKTCKSRLDISCQNQGRLKKLTPMVKFD